MDNSLKSKQEQKESEPPTKYIMAGRAVVKGWDGKSTDLFKNETFTEQIAKQLGSWQGVILKREELWVSMDVWAEGAFKPSCSIIIGTGFSDEEDRNIDVLAFYLKKKMPDDRFEIAKCDTAYLICASGDFPIKGFSELKEIFGDFINGRY